MIDHRMSARRKLIRLLSRETLHEMCSADDRPYMMSLPQLIDFVATKRWDLGTVKEGVDRLFMIADPEGTAP